MLKNVPGLRGVNRTRDLRERLDVRLLAPGPLELRVVVGHDDQWNFTARSPRRHVTSVYG